MALKNPYFFQISQYSASQLRSVFGIASGMQAGVVKTTLTPFKVTQNSSPNLSVNIAPGAALVPAFTGGFYFQETDTNAVVVQTGGTNGHATLPRVDSVILKVNDQRDAGSTSTSAQLIIRPGTPTAGATLDNRFGAPVLLTNELLLADLRMPAAATSYVTANIRDRRAWATGATATIVGPTGADNAITSTSMANAPGHSTPRLEIGSASNTVDIFGVFHGFTSTTSVALLGRVALINSATGAVVGTPIQHALTTPSASVHNSAVVADSWTPLAAGSHVASFQYAASAATSVTLKGTSTAFTRIMLRERINGNLDNS